MPIYCTLLIAVAVAATAISVWTRRYTLRLDFDRPITLSLVVQCLALWLMCPFSTSCVGTAAAHASPGSGMWTTSSATYSSSSPS